MYHKILRWFASFFLALAISVSMYTPVLAAPPANDNFADAEVITSLPFTGTADVTDATTETGEPLSCGSFPSGTVWYTFTPTQNTAARLDMAGSPTPGAVSVYLSSGPGISDLTFLTCVFSNFSNNSVNINFEAGNTYYLQMNPGSIQHGILQFNLEQIFPPANDNFAGAEVITSLPFTGTADITDATTETGEPSGCGWSGGTVWYTFTPTQKTAVRLDIAGSPNPGAVSVYLSSGPGISDLTFLACVFSNNSVNINFEAGNTYYLQMKPGSIQLGVLQFSLEQIFPPANDNFADAEVITSLSFTGTADVTDATTETGEPFGCGWTGGTVWYTFTPTQNIAARLDMAGSPTPGAGSIYLSSGSGISGLTFLTCAFSNNSVDINFQAGNTYYLQMKPGSIQLGVLQFSLEQIFPPANDNFADAEMITSLPFTGTADVTDATTEIGEPFGCGSSGGTVWYTFTPTRNIAAQLDMTGSPTPGAVSVYLSSGPGISGLTILTCVFSNNSVDINFEAGKTYYLQLKPSSTQHGILQFSLNAPNDLLQVGIDVKPGSETNPINTTSQGKIPVAILSTSDFDAPLMVDKTSLTFGRTGDETSLAFCNKGSEDVNNDGLQDQVCHFYNQETGFQVGDVEGILKGQTVDGVPIEGNDKISIVNASSEEFNVCPFEPIMITLTSPNPVKVPVQITSSGQDLNFAATDPPGIFWSLTALDNTDLFAGGPDDHVHFAWYGFNGDPGYYYVVFDHPGAGTTYPTIQVNLACDYEAPEP